MVRISLLACCLVLFLGLDGFAQKKKAAPKTPEPIRHSVGDRLITTAPIIVAVDELDAVELSKSIEAKDKEGIDAMVADKKAVVLDAGLNLVVLEITTFDLRREDKSSVCRVIKDGKAIGKHAVHYTWFTTATMKMDKKAN